MLHELRIYTTPPGMAPEVARLSAEVGQPARGDKYGKFEGYWITEMGALNQVVHLWSHEDPAARFANRTALAQNKDWTEKYVAAVLPLLTHQDVRLIHPVRPLFTPPGDGNIYEFRYYRCKPGTAAKVAGMINGTLEFRETYSKNTGIWHGDAGRPNEVCHMWAYPSFEARAEARAKTLADPRWQKFLGEVWTMIEEMHNMIMLPTAHSPMK
jgi:hypothetical protein